MATQPPSEIPFPLSSFPGATSQESSGRLLNCYSEPLGEPQRPTGPTPQVWRASPGLSQHAITAQTGYRGGLIVNNLSYEAFLNTVITVDSLGNVVVLGTFLGNRNVSIARNQNVVPDVVGVDPDNGAVRFTGGVGPYNGGGVLPQPNSVCFQSAYFFFTIGDCRCFASGINALTQNALTFITVSSKADVILLRGIPYYGNLYLFTTGGCEIWQDVAAPTPGFPYARLAVWEVGLLQTNAIAGFETDFGNLLWVAQDFGVYWSKGGNQPEKVSPPDLDRFIEREHLAGRQLEAGCYSYAGKRFWVLNSTRGSWEINLNTNRWTERSSLIGGVQGRWRGRGGHHAFGKWLVGDQLGGNLLYVDPTNYTENGAPQLCRAESGPVRKFPNGLRIARADFDFIKGQGIAVGNIVMAITGAVAGTAVPGGNRIRLTVNNTAQTASGDIANVTGVTGTVEANGTWPFNVIDATHIELVGPLFVAAYITGGTATDVTSPPVAVQPTVAISCSKDGGVTWGYPVVRQIGQQGKVLRQRASVKNMGQSSPIGDRWRLDMTDPVYRAFLGGTQSSDPRSF